MKPSLLLVLLCPFVGATAQAAGALALGAGTVRFGGGSASSLPTLSPSLSWVTPGLSAVLSGTAAKLPGAAWAYEGGGDVTLTSGPLGRWRIGGELSSTASTVTGGERTGAVTFIGELARRGAGWGLGFGGGPSASWLSGAPGIAGPHLRLRAWRDGTDVRLTGSVESTRLIGSWYTDFTAGAAWHRGPLDLAITATARASAGWGSSAGGSVVADLYVTPSVGFEVAGGSALEDPLSSFPRAGFLSADIRIFVPARPRLGDVVRAIVHANAEGVVEVTFQAAGDSVSIAGDWNGWTPEPLERVASGVWRLRRPLAPGAYRFGLVIPPNRRWVVPPGFASVPDDWGGRAAVLVVQ